jgi:hypothetical protein
VRKRARSKETNSGESRDQSKDDWKAERKEKKSVEKKVDQLEVQWVGRLGVRQAVN